MMLMSRLISIRKDVPCSRMMKRASLMLTTKVKTRFINLRDIYTRVAMVVTSVQVSSVSKPRRMFLTTAAFTTNLPSQSSSNLVDLHAGVPTVPALELTLIIFECDLILLNVERGERRKFHANIQPNLYCCPQTN